MNQEYVNNLVTWIQNNRNYPDDQLRQAAIQGGSTEEDFNAALNIINAPLVTFEYIGVGKRFLAFLIDSIIFGVLLFLFIKFFSGTYVGGCHSSFEIGATITINQDETFYGLCGLSAQFYFLTIISYYVLLEWLFGATLGKFATGIRVRKSTGEPITIKESLIRNVMRIIDMLPFLYLVGSISMGRSKTKQRIGDRVARTVVVAKKSIK